MFLEFFLTNFLKEKTAETFEKQNLNYSAKKFIKKWHLI